MSNREHDVIIEILEFLDEEEAAGSDNDCKWCDRLIRKIRQIINDE